MAVSYPLSGLPACPLVIVLKAVKETMIKNIIFGVNLFQDYTLAANGPGIAAVGDFENRQRSQPYSKRAGCSWCKERLHLYLMNRCIRGPYVQWCERRTSSLTSGEAVYSISDSLLSRIRKRWTLRIT